MLRPFSALAAALLSIGLFCHVAGAWGLGKHGARPVCEPGYKIVEETIYQEVVKTVCKMVPETKTKWVYCCVDDPLCIKDCKLFGKCDTCTLIHRKVIVKKLVDEPTPIMKCVTEQIVEIVPCIVYKKVPCDSIPTVGPVSAPPRVEVVPVSPMPADAPKK